MCHFKFSKVVLAHVIGEVDTFCTVLLAVPSRTCVPIVIEIDSYLTNTEQKISWHSFLRHGVYSTLMCGLWIFAGPPIYHLPGNVISAAVGLIYINRQRECELPSSTRFGQFQKFGKIWVEGTVLPATLTKKFLHWVWVLVYSYLRVRFDIPSSINFRDINSFHKLRAQNPY